MGQLKVEIKTEIKQEGVFPEYPEEAFMGWEYEPTEDEEECSKRTIEVSNIIPGVAWNTKLVNHFSKFGEIQGLAFEESGREANCNVAKIVFKSQSAFDKAVAGGLKQVIDGVCVKLGISLKRKLELSELARSKRTSIGGSVALINVYPIKTEHESNNVAAKQSNASKSKQTTTLLSSQPSERNCSAGEQESTIAGRPGSPMRLSVDPPDECQLGQLRFFGERNAFGSEFEDAFDELPDLDFNMQPNNAKVVCPNSLLEQSKGADGDVTCSGVASKEKLKVLSNRTGSTRDITEKSSVCSPKLLIEPLLRDEVHNKVQVTIPDQQKTSELFEVSVVEEPTGTLSNATPRSAKADNFGYFATSDEHEASSVKTESTSSSLKQLPACSPELSFESLQSHKVHNTNAVLIESSDVSTTSTSMPDESKISELIESQALSKGSDSSVVMIDDPEMSVVDEPTDTRSNATSRSAEAETFSHFASKDERKVSSIETESASSSLKKLSVCSSEFSVESLHSDTAHINNELLIKSERFENQASTKDTDLCVVILDDPEICVVEEPTDARSNPTSRSAKAETSSPFASIDEGKVSTIETQSITTSVEKRSVCYPELSAENLRSDKVRTKTGITRKTTEKKATSTIIPDIYIVEQQKKSNSIESQASTKNGDMCVVILDDSEVSIVEEITGTASNGTSRSVHWKPSGGLARKGGDHVSSIITDLTIKSPESSRCDKNYTKDDRRKLSDENSTPRMETLSFPDISIIDQPKKSKPHEAAVDCQASKDNDNSCVVILDEHEILFVEQPDHTSSIKATCSPKDNPCEIVELPFKTEPSTIAKQSSSNFLHSAQKMGKSSLCVSVSPTIKREENCDSRSQESDAANPLLSPLMDTKPITIKEEVRSPPKRSRYRPVSFSPNQVRSPRLLVQSILPKKHTKPNAPKPLTVQPEIIKEFFKRFGDVSHLEHMEVDPHFGHNAYIVFIVFQNIESAQKATGFGLHNVGDQRIILIPDTLQNNVVSNEYSEFSRNLSWKELKQANKVSKTKVKLEDRRMQALTLPASHAGREVIVRGLPSSDIGLGVGNYFSQWGEVVEVGIIEEDLQPISLTSLQCSVEGKQFKCRVVFREKRTTQTVVAQRLHTIADAVVTAAMVEVPCLNCVTVTGLPEEDLQDPQHMLSPFGLRKRVRLLPTPTGEGLEVTFCRPAAAEAFLLSRCLSDDVACYGTMQPEGRVEDRRVHVHSIPHKMDYLQLQDYFSEFGEVSSCKYPRRYSPHYHHLPATATITYSTISAAVAALTTTSRRYCVAADSSARRQRQDPPRIQPGKVPAPTESHQHLQIRRALETLPKYEGTPHQIEEIMTLIKTSPEFKEVDLQLRTIIRSAETSGDLKDKLQEVIGILQSEPSSADVNNLLQNQRLGYHTNVQPGFATQLPACDQQQVDRADLPQANCASLSQANRTNHMPANRANPPPNVTHGQMAGNSQVAQRRNFVNDPHQLLNALPYHLGQLNNANNTRGINNNHQNKFPYGPQLPHSSNVNQCFNNTRPPQLLNLACQPPSLFTTSLNFSQRPPHNNNTSRYNFPNHQTAALYSNNQHCNVVRHLPFDQTNQQFPSNNYHNQSSYPNGRPHHYFGNNQKRI